MIKKLPPTDPAGPSGSWPIPNGPPDPPKKLGKFAAAAPVAGPDSGLNGAGPDLNGAGPPGLVAKCSELAHSAAGQAKPLVFGFGEEGEEGQVDRPEGGEGGSCDEKLVPVTVLSGFLGSGKTTLLNRILTSHHGKRIAVIQNEFGEDLGLGSALAAEGKAGQIFEECFEMNNGCICCSVRDDLINTLERIMRNRHKFDYILVETTGMANPGPIASIFWLDSELESSLHLDAIVTLVDAKHILKHLDDPSLCSSFEAAQQIAFADRILLNKIDLVTESEVEAVEGRLREINGVAPIYRTRNSEIDLDNILDVKAFDAERAKEVELGASGESDKGCEHGEDCSEHEHSSKVRHDGRIGTVSCSEDRALDERKLNLWLGGVLWENEGGMTIFRIKGLLTIHGEETQMVLQGVHNLFDILPAQAQVDSLSRSKIVFIGQNLDRLALQQGLSSCVKQE
eukprot:763350-Hanusia_phi.AAC.2